MNSSLFLLIFLFFFQKKLRIKLYLEEDVRLVTLSKKPNAKELLEIVYQKFNTYAEIDKYEDHDGDKVIVENERDLEEAFKIYYSLKESRPQLLHTLKLFLKRIPNQEIENSTEKKLNFYIKDDSNRKLVAHSSDSINNTKITTNNSKAGQNYLRDYHSPLVSSAHLTKSPTSPSTTPPVSFVEYHGGSYDSESMISITKNYSNFPIDSTTTNVRSRSFSNPAPPHSQIDYMASHYQGGLPPSSSTSTITSLSSQQLLINSSRASLPQISRQLSASRNFDNIKWKKGQLLGVGGYGSVYLGLLETGEIIAVKQIEFAHPGSDPALIQKLEEAKKEIEIMKRLQHDHIVQYLGSQVQDNVISIFLE